MPELIPPPLTLYIHFPWCVRKCPYCDFNSHALRGDLDENGYVDALLADLQQDLPAVWGRPVHAIFMGGGTPSLFSAAAMARLLSTVRALLPMAPDAEINLEVNPGTGEYDRFAGYREAGINRLSFGVQSLDDGQLKTLGRIHNAKQARQAVAQAQQAGFDNINLDIMFGLPGQTRQAAADDLSALLALQPQHVSAYQLTLEANTLFAVQPPPGLPDTEQLELLYEQTREQLAAAGFEQYEVSAYARPGQRSRHNLNYWRFGDYLGIGAGAHGKITDGAAQTITRTVKQKHPRVYFQTAHSDKRIQKTEEITPQNRLFEYLLNRLRLREPFSLAHFEQATGLPRKNLLDTLQPAFAWGAIRQQEQHLELTDRGFLLSDEIIKLALP
jgi:oxygen-independent coproporphyrinogen-3 oxidase